PLITAIGLSIVLQQLVWGFYPDAKKPRSFPEFQGESFKLLDNLYLQRADAFVLVLAPLCMLALGLFVAKSRSGRAMQATAQDPDTAKLMGINTDRIIVMAFAIGAAFAAVASVAYGLDKGQINFEMGFILGLKAFTAAV
ncbi:branched-chain amino acid ABC transporter permease, partial [Streptomyces sp. SID7982]|nr:branched-chain amino acid ABC transporter permease [Streptomyces sp. SID7982]